MLTEIGLVQIQAPRDRDGSFDLCVGKRERRKAARVLASHLPSAS